MTGPVKRRFPKFAKLASAVTHASIVFYVAVLEF